MAGIISGHRGYFSGRAGDAVHTAAKYSRTGGTTRQRTGALPPTGPMDRKSLVFVALLYGTHFGTYTYPAP